MNYFAVTSSSQDYTGYVPIIFLAIAVIIIIRKVFLSISNDVQTSQIPPEVEQKKIVVGYQYRRKKYLMTSHEHDFFNLLNKMFGDKYFVFPQMQLSSLLDHKVYKQNWKGALGRINQKSVDYVICDKIYLNPLVAIELDDWSHDSEDRIERDGLVEAIFEEAQFPLVRFRNLSNISDDEIFEKICDQLPQQQNNTDEIEYH